MHKENINIWGRDFSLEIYYEKYPDEPVSASQRKAFETFKSAENQLQASIQDIKEYVLKDHPEQFDSSGISNIFRFVMPKYIFVPLSYGDRSNTVAIMCDYRFDAEHGLAVIFEDGRLKEIGSQDLIL